MMMMMSIFVMSLDDEINATSNPNSEGRENGRDYTQDPAMYRL